MAKFFGLNSATEKKEISRETRIFADGLVLQSNQETTFNTDSVAPYAKIKFFLDAIVFKVGETEIFYRVGKYFELEFLQTAQVITEQGFFTLGYSVRNDGGVFNFVFSWKNEWADVLPIENTFDVDRIYISNINFEDSFYQASGGWLNKSNPNNILDKIVTQKLPGVRRMDLSYFKATPWFTVNKWNENYTLFEDDFIRIDVFSNAATNRLMAILPKGNAKLKEHEAEFTTPANNPKHYHTTGFMQEKPTATALFCRPVLLANEWGQALVNAINPGVPLDGEATGAELIEDICFTFNCNTNIVRQFRMVWDAIDGYTYGLDIDFFSNTVSASSGVFNFNIEAIYLGRQLTGQIPVTEGGI